MELFGCLGQHGNDDSSRSESSGDWQELVLVPPAAVGCRYLYEKERYFHSVASLPMTKSIL